MNRKRVIVVLFVFLALIVSGFFLLRKTTDKPGGKSDSIYNDVIQEDDTKESDATEQDVQKETELPIILPSIDNQEESKKETSGLEESSGIIQKDNSDDASEDIVESDDNSNDNSDMELPFVPAT